MNSLDKHVFLEKISNKYVSLKNHLDTANDFYNEHAGDVFKKVRAGQAKVRELGKGKGKLIMVPIEDEF